MQNNLNKNAVFECKIEGYTAEGMGVARIEGVAVFIPNAAREDVLRVRIVKVLSNYAFAITEEILTPSPHRAQPACVHFPGCGGCNFQHITYEEELYLKHRRVQDALTRIGGFDITVEPCMPSPKTEGYRNKCQFPIGLNEQEKAVFGFYRSRSHRLVPITSCLIQDERANVLAKTVCDWIDENRISVYNEDSGKGLIRHVYIRTAAETAQLCIVATSQRGHRWQSLVVAATAACPQLRSIVLNVNPYKTNRVLGDENVTLWGNANLSDKLLDMTFSLSPLAFYQVNHDQAEAVYNKVIELAGPDENADVLDLYCGTGTITLALAKHFNSAVGIELVAPAIEDAQKNATVNGISNVRFLCSDASKAATTLAEEGFAPQVIVTDPPRKGMDEEAIAAVLQMAPKRIVYVSCDCASLARDGAKLAAGGYVLRSASPYDMFPKTANVETVALFERE